MGVDHVQILGVPRKADLGQIKKVRYFVFLRKVERLSRVVDRCLGKLAEPQIYRFGFFYRG